MRLRVIATVPMGALACALLGGCPLTSFEVDLRPAEGGSAGSGGGPAPNGGSPSLGGARNQEGGIGSVTRPRVVDDEYVFVQGAPERRVTAAEGLLANDTPVGLSVVDVTDVDPLRPTRFDAELSVDEDGGFVFRPAAAFFGLYRLAYTAENSLGQAATGGVLIRVIPSEIDLDTLIDGLGGYVLYGPAAAGFGTAIDRAFDVNGDGRRDLVIGAPSTGAGAGAAFVVFGKDDLEPIGLEPLLANTERRFAVISAGASELLGVSVGGLGDWDGDGVPDLVLGASGGDGKAYVVSGSDVTGALTLPSTRGYVFEGDSANANVGRLVRGAGDVNGDGVPDALVSASNGDYGWLHVLFGSLGLAGRSTVTGAPGLHVSGAQPKDRFPLSAAGVGDLDGDGAAEVLASADSGFVLLRGGIGYPSDVGQLTLDGSRGGWSSRRTAPGDAAVAGLGDVNGDGVPDFGFCEGTTSCRILFGPPSTLAGGWLVYGFSRQTRQVQLAGGGDVDGDGLADVLVSDDRAAYLVYGKRGGHTDIDVSLLGADGYALRAASGGAITAITILGDTNGDGLADLALADATADDGAGRVYVVFGVASR